MPDAAWAANGLPPGSSQDCGATLVLTSSEPFSTRQRQRTLAHRSSPRPTPDAVQPRLLPRRSAQRSSANAPVGGLKPPPVGRLRRARQPPSLLQHRSRRDHHVPIRPTSYVRVHNTTAVILIAAALSPRDAWEQPILRLADTALGIATGVVAAWITWRVTSWARRGREPPDRDATRASP